MPVKILLADKSITIQKVVEMLFSGREYEVVCVSDGEKAIAEAERSAPDVVLADVDLPRLDGYAFAARLKSIRGHGRTPVILMMSRDDVYDSVKGKQSGIIDSIVKPFESQELIGKVKKSLAAASPPAAEPADRHVTIPSAPVPKSAPAAATPRSTAPTDIFSIISEAPPARGRSQAVIPDEEDGVYEVEPEVEEAEELLAQEIPGALPTGAKAVEEIRAGMGLSERQDELQPEIATLEAFETGFGVEEDAPGPQKPVVSPVTPSATIPLQQPRIDDGTLKRMVEETVARTVQEAVAKLPKPQPPALSESDLWSIADETVSRVARDFFAKMPPVQPPQVSGEALQGLVEKTVSTMTKEAIEKMPVVQPASLPEHELRLMAEQTFSRLARDVFRNMTPPPVPKISEETIRRGIEEAVMKICREVAKDVIEHVAWEVIPQLAEHLIKEEIERLKAEP